MINCSFLQKPVNIDLSTVRTLIELKENIIDLFNKERKGSLRIHDIILSLSGKSFDELDDKRLLLDLGIKDKTVLQVDHTIKSDKPFTQSSAPDEYN